MERTVIDILISAIKREFEANANNYANRNTFKC